MQNIFSHIAYLLTKHECVIIPGFGALVHSDVLSRNTVDEDVFSPPAISLGFNSELKHNDGVLADSIKREQKISYNEANKMVSDFSAKLNEQLKNKKKVTISQVGCFVLSENKKINFSPATDLSANASQFGFKNFYIPLLSEIIIAEEKEEAGKAKGRNVVLIPFSKRLFTVASVAAIVLIFMLLSTPISNKDIPAQYAGMFFDLQEERVVGNTKESDATVLKEMREEITPDRQKITPSVKPESEKSEENKTIEDFSDGYLIVIASFPNKGEAERMLSYFKKEFSSAAIIERSDRSRIYVRSFQDKGEAENFLEKFRQDNPKYKDAWLLSNKAKG